MATFKTQIEDLTSAVGDDGALNQWLTDGAKEIINLLPEKLKLKCAAATTLNNSTSVMDMDAVGEILFVTRLSSNTGGFQVPCRQIPSIYGGLATDSSNIMYYATPTDPVYWIDGNTSDASTLYVKPTPEATQVSYVHHISYPDVGGGDSIIANFPDEAEYLVVLYASIKGLQRLMNNMNSVTAIDTTAFDAANTELDETQTICDLINTQVDSAVSEIAEAATEVDAQIDTACDAITTAAGRVNTAVGLANAEFDKCSALLDLGETDTEGAVNTALAAMVTELGETQAICDLINTQVDSAVSAATLATIEAIEIQAQTDNSSDFATALTAINTAVDKFRADGSDPALFGDEDTYDTSNSEMTRVKDALDKARNLIDGATMSGDTEPESAQYWLNDEDTEMAQATVNTAQMEVQRAQAHIAEWNATVQALQSEINGFATEVQSRAAFTGAKGQSVQALMSNASGLIQAAQGYANEIQTKIGISGGYGQEVQIRLAQAQAKREESNSRIASGNAFLQEAQTSAQEAQTYVNEVNARVAQIGGYGQIVSGYLNSAQGYANEIQSKIGIAQGYIAEANTRMQRESQKYQWYQAQQTKLQQDYNQGVTVLIGASAQPQQQKAQ
jgi:hypothetical protein